MENSFESVLIIRKEGKVVGIAHNDLDKKVMIIYAVEDREMGLEEIKELLDKGVPKE